MPTDATVARLTTLVTAQAREMLAVVDGATLSDAWASIALSWAALVSDALETPYDQQQAAVFRGARPILFDDEVLPTDMVARCLKAVPAELHGEANSTVVTMAHQEMAERYPPPVSLAFEFAMGASSEDPPEVATQRVAAMQETLTQMPSVPIDVTPPWVARTPWQYADPHEARRVDAELGEIAKKMLSLGVTAISLDTDAISATVDPSFQQSIAAAAPTKDKLALAWAWAQILGAHQQKLREARSLELNNMATGRRIG
jgi:hypothetical protein